MPPDLIKIFQVRFIDSISFFNKSIGEVLADKESYDTLMLLLSELNSLANSKKIKLPENCIDSVISKYKKLPFDITTSMHSDYLNHKKVTELHSLCEYVILEGIKYKQEYPTYAKVFSTLSSTN